MPLRRRSGSSPNPGFSLDELDRRSFLKLGAAGAAALATVSFSAALSGCGRREHAAAQGFRWLRDADIVMLRALAPVVLDGVALADTDVEASLRRADHLLGRAGTPAQSEVRKLFDLLQWAPTRRFVAGLSHDWNQAQPDELRAWLSRWRGSRIGVFNGGYRLLTRLVASSYFGLPVGGQLAGYPGPLDWVYRSVNS